MLSKKNYIDVYNTTLVNKLNDAIIGEDTNDLLVVNSESIAKTILELYPYAYLLLNLYISYLYSQYFSYNLTYFSSYLASVLYKDMVIEHISLYFL